MPKNGPVGKGSHDRRADGFKYAKLIKSMHLLAKIAPAAFFAAVVPWAIQPPQKGLHRRPATLAFWFFSVGRLARTLLSFLNVLLHEADQTLAEGTKATLRQTPCFSACPAFHRGILFPRSSIANTHRQPFCDFALSSPMMNCMGEMKRREAHELGQRDGSRFLSTLVIAAAIIAAVRPAREDIGRPSPRVSATIADSISLARSLLDGVLRRFSGR